MVDIFFLPEESEMNAEQSSTVVVTSREPYHVAYNAYIANCYGIKFGPSRPDAYTISDRMNP